MSSCEILTIRYPSGVTEDRLRNSAPAVGEVLEIDDRRWVVENVAEAPDRRFLVTLRAHLALVDAEPDPASQRKRDMLVALHERAARFHDEAAELQAEHVEEMTAKNEPAKAARAERLVKKERKLAERHRALAARRRS